MIFAERNAKIWLVREESDREFHAHRNIGAGEFDSWVDSTRLIRLDSHHRGDCSHLGLFMAWCRNDADALVNLE